MKHKILLVDDQEELRSLLGQNFKARGYEVMEAPDGTTVKSLFTGLQPDVVLLDLKLPDADGLDHRGWLPGTSRRGVRRSNEPGDHSAGRGNNDPRLGWHRSQHPDPLAGKLAGLDIDDGGLDPGPADIDADREQAFALVHQK